MKIFLLCFNSELSESYSLNIYKEDICLFVFNITKSANNKLLSLYAQWIVKYIASIQLNTDMSSIVFSYGSNGKPYISEYPNFQFNISHTKDALVVAVTNVSVGIDIEKIESANMNIANKFFSKREQRFINLANDNQDKRFFEIWTKKEAYIKWTGEGLSQSLSSFDVTAPEIHKLFKTFEIDKYIISVCTSWINK